MAEPSPEIAKRQFDKFATAYNVLHKTNFVWDCVNPVQNDNWDFRGYDKNSDEFLYIQYAEAISYPKTKGKIEAHKRGKYTFEFAPGVKFAFDAIDRTYIKKQIKADKSVVLIIGFHDYSYERENKLDGIEKIREHMKNKYNVCAFKELWIMNLPPDPFCDFVF